MRLKLLFALLIFTNNLLATTEVAPPSNDDFANAIPLVCGNNYTSSTAEATLDEDNAPDSTGPLVDLDAPNIWYSYTGSGIPEIITLDLCASGYDTSYLVYTGTSGNLTLVAANDDNADQCGPGYRSYGTFESDGTTTYYITITGYGPTNIGAVDLTVSCIPVGAEEIPDSNFEQALIDVGLDSGPVDGYIYPAALDQVTALNISNKNISDLTGIEFFTSLQTLNCSNNNLSALNLTANTSLTTLNCSFNSLTTVILKDLPNLNLLLCNNNQLTRLNVKNGNNTNFIAFSATGNPNMSCIEVDNPTYSTANWLNIDTGVSFAAFCDPVTYIPDNNFEQELIDRGFDDVLDDYVITANINTVTAVDLANDDVADLTGIEDFTALQYLYANGNQLTSVDLTQNTALITLEINGNNISTIDLRQNTALVNLQIWSNPITTIDLSQNVALEKANFQRCQLTAIDVSQNIALKDLSVIFNSQISAIDVSANPNLEKLGLTSTQISTLDLTNNPNLKDLFLGNCPISDIDISTNLALEFLNISETQIQDVDVSNHPVFDALFAENTTTLTNINVQNGNNTNFRFFYTRNTPNLECVQVDDVAYSTANWTFVDAGINFSTLCAGTNDECVDAINIPISNSSCGNAITGTMSTATDSNSLHCFGNNANFSDVWFSFTATETSHVIQLQNLTGSPDFLWHTVIDAQTYNCNNINQAIYCTDALEGTATGLTVGNMYYVQVYSHAANANTVFDICVSPVIPPSQVYVPDDNFEQALIDLGYDDVLDDYVLEENINTITTLNVSDKNIADLTGIEGFENLEELNCQKNGLTSLNVSQNLALKILSCGNGPAVVDNPNQITSLDVSQNVNLEILRCDNNPLNTLDVSVNTNLITLDCIDTNITSLDVSQNTNLESLSCGYNNLTNLDISQNTLLRFLYVINSQLTTLDVSNNTQLQYLYAGSNSYTTLDVSGNTDLVLLWVSNTQLTSLDLSNNSSLESLFASSIAQLTSLDIANGANQNIETFSVFNTPNLTCIQVDDPTYSTTNWTTVGSGTSFSTDCNYSVNDECVDAINIPISDVSCGNAVTGTIQYATDSNSLHCFGNDANFSDVWFSFVATEETHKITLQNLIGTPNFLWHTVIDAQTYNCSGTATPIICNDGLSGDVTGLTIGNTYYIQVYSHEANANTTFDICVASITVPGETYVPDDNFEQALIDLGYDTVLDDYVTTANINTVEALDVSSKSISDLTGIEDFIALKDLKCESNNLTNLNITQNTLLTHVHAYGNSLGSIDLTQNIALKELFLSDNQLGELDVSQNTALEDLGVFTNPQLASVDVSANPNLKTLNVSFTQVSVLDVSNNLALTSLSLADCPVTEIDVTANTALTFLGARGTLVTSIDVSQNPVLEVLSCRNNSVLANVNIQNGNNTNISLFFATNTPNLSCVQVDDVAYSIANWTLVDPGINFSTNCPTLVYVPDDNFEQELINLGYDDVLDDYVLESNVNTVTILSISDKNIADLTGIEAFAALEELHVTNNPLGSLNLTQNVALELLNANNTSISTIDLTQNAALQYLSIESNSLTTVDITQNTALISASFQTNQLTAIDVSQNTMLQSLNLVQNNQLTAVDVTNNPNLVTLNLNFTQVSNIDVTNNLLLETLSAASCPITTINVANNTALKILGLVGTPITKVDVSNNPIFESLYVSNCSDLTGINIQNGNNTNVQFFFTLNTPSLTCVQVDDVAYSTTNWLNVDSGINFSLDCGFLENDECVDAISVPISTVLCDNTVSGTLAQSTNSNSFQCFGDSPGFSDVWFSFVATETTHNIKTLNTSGANSRVFHAVIDAQTYNCGNITDAIYCTDSTEGQATGLIIGNTYFIQVYTDTANSTETFDVCVSTISSPGLTYVPDDNFEQALIDLGLDTTLDDYVVTSNINTVNDLNIRNLSIFDLTGIEDFAALEILNCGLNFLGELDLSSNTNLNYLIADNAALTSLNVQNGNNTNVTTFITLGNIDLFCIQVDDAAYSTTNWTIIEPTTSFNEFCGNPIQLEAKVFLQGAMLQHTDGFMRTDLKDNNHVSLTSPYSDGIDVVDNVFLATGQDKIVDWVWVELRDATNPATIIDGKSAILQRDGDIVDASTINTPVNFSREAGDYYVVIKHRNHLGIMSNSALSLSNTVTTVDFTDRNNQITYGTNAQTNFGMPADIVAMWCGNVNGDTVVQYSGTTPDAPAILSTVLNDAGNFLNFPTYIVSGYDSNDVNMDGNTQYAGTNPDTPFILQNILTHPGNFLNFSTYQITEQLPINE